LKELERLSYPLTRPSRVGIFNKDNFILPFIHALLFFIGYIGVIAATIFNTMYLGKDTADDATEILQVLKFANKIELKEGQITYDSTSKSFKTTLSGYKDFSNVNYGLYVYFFIGENAHKVPNDSLVLEFEETKVNVYYNTMFMQGPVSYSYSDSIARDFDLYDVLEGDMDSTISFNQIVSDAISKANIRYQFYTFMTEAARAFAFYALVILFLLILSSFTNGAIELGVRFKLVLYDSIPYSFIMMLTYMFNFSYLQYLALIIPFIYTIITFRHILRIKKQ